MSDNHNQLQVHTPVGEVEHTHVLSEHIGALFLNDEYSDVTFLVEDKKFPAHRIILAARCEYFRALLFGGMRESKPGTGEIPLPETSAIAFQALLRYIYTGKINLADLKEENILDVLGLAHKYGFLELEASISDYLRAILNIRNVCMVYDVATLYSLLSLCHTCCEFMDKNALEVLNSDGFLTLSHDALKEIISRDSFCAPEKDIFAATLRWSEEEPNKNEDVRQIVKSIRLPLMSLAELLNVVRPTNLVEPDNILDAIKTRSESRDMDLNYRGFLTPEENIATLRHGASVIKGEMKAALLDGDCTNYDLDRGFTRHPIEENNGGVVVKLGQPSIINTIRLLLWDRDTRSYSYYLEVSMDEKDWLRVVDHSRYLCRSWQTLHFPTRVIKYVRIVGVHNTVNKVFHLVSFECLYTNKPFQLEKGLLVPSENVATTQHSASVIEGVSRSRNALLNGDTKNYDWDSGYTCHQLGSGAIVVQLAQPFIVGSMRLLLWDCDDRSYSYYIEVSTDQQHWELVCDKTREACRSWQTIFFEKRPVTFIRIVGTHNTANEVFHCVHFECPANPNSPAPSDDGSSDSSSVQGAMGGPPPALDGSFHAQYNI
ncbi:PREDICTED: BTB/POZ domain-containing protein 9-like [Branchiostoma belcheri]|uniref:BTB/POZ domain-containing protein 9 n=1 Tax=Branchiostoma belcheri TaxID=7741 RepID=A0A6P4Z4Q1_BRABE|nr:PREDICTED: BTB/POZ domain-containing protein 9-like [Branchiostoma belcheri]XP_019624566.1 PREDICTED: BTB/POZ domain-containing protein 9-like [Branchiostoma belcheri]KAI8480542.1 BTB/POZ domain-containing protein 9 [Branchiostoma belcheri]